ncbi:hypothetical protein BB558_005452 [Smittium angustum]|uniref:Uncharacterized protein n=1 Tax=Smittium angustum TaxID=133377 RepID=A0A2U1J0N3_SMIAN|nr:hypothetical protein BB558_005452 [Smittium angustum]
MTKFAMKKISKNYSASENFIFRLSSQHMLPCSHMMFVIRHKKLQFEAFCDESWSKNLFLQEYNNSSSPVPLGLLRGLNKYKFAPPEFVRKKEKPKARQIESQNILELLINNKVGATNV